MIRSTSIRRLIVLLAALALTATAACERRSHSPAPSAKPRLVSLSPAMTQMILDLGKGDEIVAVGTYDPVAPAGAKVVGDLYRIDYEQLLALQPTDIFIQPPASGVPDKLKELAAAHGWRVHSYRIETLADMLNALRGEHFETDPTMGVGGALGVPLAAQDLAAKIEVQLASIAIVMADQAKPRVLALISEQPLTAVGPGTFLDELLRLAGSQSVMAHAKAPYPSLTLERVIALAPDVIVVLDTSGRPDETWTPPATLSGLNVPAAKNGRIVRLSGQTVGLPSTTVVDTTMKLVQLLHPDRAAVRGLLPNDPRKP